MFIWSQKYETRIDLVDIQHKNLFNLLNKLCSTLESGNINHKEIDSAIKVLIHYTKTHLHDEELLMMDSRIDERFFSRHRMEHKSFLYDVDRFSEIFSSDDSTADRAEKLVRFIAFWLIAHILGTDLVMAEQMACIKAGMTPQQAFERAKEQKLDPVMVKMMLDAIMNLWIDSKARCTRLENKCSELEKKLEATRIESIELASNFTALDL
ncbi:MAG: hemerythrin domain-containing protein [Proteobacteria bacterium]|nr:hemerythrin domain-containing protein [Pseudomonadota bacterium]